MEPEPDIRSSRLDYRAVYAATRFYGHAFQRIQQHTPCPIPPQGPALVIANHTSGLDPTVIQATCRRPIAWLMTREFYDVPHMQWFFRWARMIPLEVSGHDTTAWREAIRRLKLGHVVGVFPEGRIEREDRLLPFQSGVSLLGIRGGADFYPVYVDGLQRNTPMLESYLLPQHPSVAWGRPLPAGRATTRRRVEEVTGHLQASVESLREQFPARRRKGMAMLR